MSMSTASKHEKGGACNILGKYEKWREHSRQKWREHSSKILARRNHCGDTSVYGGLLSRIIKKQNTKVGIGCTVQARNRRQWRIFCVKPSGS
jgi:hypothetical protein